MATLNDLLGRISEAAAVKGRFHAAASHELRTPLQALSGHLEVALSRVRTNAAYRAAIEEADRQTRRLTSLVQDLLLLNGLESAASRPAQEPVNLADECERILSQLHPLAESRGLTVKAALPTDRDILAPPTHVQMLLRNLIENALKYAALGGGVCVEIISAVAQTQVRICNDFPPTVQLDIERLFEPFFRPDPGRSSGASGNGLGLAICRAIAVGNGWDLALRQQGLEVCVTVTFKSTSEA